MESNDATWHPEVLPEHARRTLSLLGRNSGTQAFYLARGTALALQWGHRTSVDLDFFTSDAFNEDALIADLAPLPGMQVISKAPESLHLHIGSTKVSFLGYAYPVLFPFQTFETVSVADPRDIAVMKLSAIASRGAKRDFVDFYVLSLRYGLRELLNIFQQKFVGAEYNLVHILKSLTYFRDADNEPMPHLLQPIHWDEIKDFFTRETPPLRNSTRL